MGGTGGRKIGGRKRNQAGIGVRSINMNHQQNPTVDPSVVVHCPETIHSLDNGTLIGELGKKNTYALIPSSRFLLNDCLFLPTVPVNAMQKSNQYILE